MPDSVEMPAPVKATMRLASAIICCSASTFAIALPQTVLLPSSCRRILSDHRRTLFGDHDGWCVGIGRGHGRHDGSVYHPQTGKATHLETGIDHRHRILAHLTGADDMVDGGALGADKLGKLVPADDAGTGRDFSEAVRRQCR